MPAGRCRMHGGASIGPRTAESLERIRAALTTHGRDGTDAQASSGSDGRGEAAGGADVMPPIPDSEFEGRPRPLPVPGAATANLIVAQIRGLPPDDPGRDRALWLWEPL
jgi:hypothetical protein